MIEISKVIENIEVFSPPSLAEDWDPVGLLVGSVKTRTTGAVISVDLTRAALDLAVSRGYRLIITHHPCIFPKKGGFTHLTEDPDHPASLKQLILEAAQKRISIYACHSNFDQGSLEVCQTVASGLGFNPKGRLLEPGTPLLQKLVVFVPTTHLLKVREALCAAGAGQIGDYDFCTFSTPGTGTFRGSVNSKPFLGKPGKLETASEIRLETIYPKGLEPKILRALRASHPYQEIAYDLIPLSNTLYPSAPLVSGIGYGVWGEFSKKISFAELAQRVKDLFNLKGFLVSDPSPSKIKRVAFAAGKGASFVSAAQAIGCEVLITGEAGYHLMLESSRKGMAIIEMGHRESERFFLKVIKNWLSDLDLKIAISKKPSQRWYD